MFNQICTCKHCGSDKLMTQTAYVEDPFYPYNIYRVKCCNCGAVLSDEQEQETTTVSDLVRLVDQMSAVSMPVTEVYRPPYIWIWELEHFPEHFYRNANGDLMWLGYNVVVVGDGEEFYAMVNKIIPKEN